jgi:protein O-GlcNAc transferase
MRLAAANLRRAARSECGSPHGKRLVFAPRRPNAEHLARYRVADLALDTFPYTSHTTMSDALWCGCPAIALRGTTFAGRVSSSVLSAAGLPDLVVANLDDYEACALRLAQDEALREEVRVRVAAARESSPLFDSKRFARDLEALYESLLRAR